MALSSALMAMALFLFATVNSQASNIGLSVLEYFFQSMFNAVLYGWTPEAFPAYIRGTASGLASFFGRLFSIVAPLAAQRLLPAGTPQAEIPWQDYIPLLYLGGGVAFGATLFTTFLPNKMVNGSQAM
jgi:MFS family permease